MFEIKGKVALITGGAQGIGFSIAKELLRNKLKGVAIVDIDTIQGNKAVDELTTTFTKDCAIFINANVAVRSEFEEAFEKTIRAFDQLDIVVNNAGIIQEIEWEKCIAVNLQGCITGSNLALTKYFPMCPSNSQKLILNVASTAGLVPVEIVPVYSGTKHGVIGFSKAIAGPVWCDCGNVKVLVICPGPTESSIYEMADAKVFESVRQIFKEGISAISMQKLEQLSKHVISIMQKGKSGSVWKVEDNVCTEV